MMSTSNFEMSVCPCYYLYFIRSISLTSIYLILHCVKHWHSIAHLGLLASAHDSVSETELSECYLILKGYYSGLVRVCLRPGTHTGCKSPNSIGSFTFTGPLQWHFATFIAVLLVLLSTGEVLLTEKTGQTANLDVNT